MKHIKAISVRELPASASIVDTLVGAIDPVGSAHFALDTFINAIHAITPPNKDKEPAPTAD
jgi:hypothetical protein